MGYFTGKNLEEKGVVRCTQSVAVVQGELELRSVVLRVH